LRDIFKDYHPRLHEWLARWLRDPSEADGLAQEVLFRAASQQDSQPVQEPLAYVYGVALEVISELPRRSPAAREEDATLQRDIHAALQELPPLYRDVLLLCKRDGHSYEEASRRLGLTAHSVEKHLVRARARLLELLIEDGDRGKDMAGAMETK